MSATEMSAYAMFIFKSRYARWLDEQGRRENWTETVDRYIEFFRERIPQKQRDETCQRLKKAILGMDVMPSMRALMTAGKALDRDNIAGYNCSYVVLDDVRAFDEAMYISMCGTGVGFSVEEQFVSKLPSVSEYFYPTETIIKVKDSRMGWASAFREMLSLLYMGLIPRWDLSLIRPAGSLLKTFGGRASGPGVLDELFKFSVRLFQGAAGRKLTSVECHDMMCKIAEVVVCGGVRRSAMISLSNLSDERMRNAKNGQWWKENAQRALANNSAVYTEKPDIGMFMKEWMSLYESRSGERGIFNRAAAHEQVKRLGRRKMEDIEFGTNPCAEIILRPQGLCNLSEVVVRPWDTEKALAEKVELATIIGTLQSTLTDFRYLRKEWKKNADEERLLGVSLTGVMDNSIMSRPSSDLRGLLCSLKKTAIEVNREWAERMGIAQSAAITCVKPSGTVSQLVNSSPGIHARFGKKIMRAVRNSKADPISTFLKNVGVPYESDLNQPESTDVFYFPLESPNESVVRSELSAVQQLELYTIYRQHWCEHNVSCFSGATKFITDKGILPFNQFSNGDSVRVLGKDGQWKDAFVNKFSKQRIWEVEVERCGIRQVIETTANHEWPLTYGAQRWANHKEKLCTTDKLSRYMGKRTFVTTNPKFKVDLDKDAVLHGLVYGDGTSRMVKFADGSDAYPSSCQIYLCNDPNGVDSRKASPLFQQAGYKLVPRPDINQIRIYGLPSHWKCLPDIETSTPSYLRGFIAGWFAADGHISNYDGQSTICSVDKSSLEWLQQASPKAGLATSTRIQEHEVKGYGGVKSAYVLCITKETLDDDFFILEEKRRRFSPAVFSKYWKIVRVTETSRLEPVFCVEEPMDSHFVLEGNILTHNCTVQVREHEWLEVANWVYKNFNEVCGLSFLPYSEHIYKQAPYRELSEQEYKETTEHFPQVEWARLSEFETEDHTTATHEMACSGNLCELAG